MESISMHDLVVSKMTFSAYGQGTKAKAKLMSHSFPLRIEGSNEPGKTRVLSGMRRLDVKVCARMVSFLRAMRTSSMSLISALTWIRLLPKDHLQGKARSADCSRGLTREEEKHRLRSNGEPGKGSLVEEVSKFELGDSLETAAVEELETKEEEREASLSSERVSAEVRKEG
jgi:hypothetical protein